MKRIHIVGMGPRTGTTLIAEAMIACFDIDLFTHHEDRIFTQPAGDGNVYLTKAPRDIVVIRPILMANPSLYVICMIRDPRDAVVSKHQKDPEKYWASLCYWNTYSRYFRKLQKHPRCITVKYEDLVSNPDHVQETLSERMPFLKYKVPFSQYHEYAKPSKDSLDALESVRAIAPVGVGNYRNHLPRVAGQIQLHGSIADDLIEFGYEADDRWMKMLEGITPNLESSHWSEFMSKEVIRNLKRGKYRETLKSLLRRIGIDPAKAKRLFRLTK